MLKQFLGFVAALLTVGAYIPYVRGIFKGSVQPHFFSWLIWALCTFLVFVAQLKSDGGPGAWVIGLSGLISILISVLAFFKKSDVPIRKLDWFFLVTALASLPLWKFTHDPVWSVILLTIVDLLGFGPTLRKAWTAPQSESLPFFGIMVVRNALVVSALESYSVTNWFFPVLTGVACFAVVLVILLRRSKTVSAWRA